jgi:hypothetical protein
MKRVQKSSLEAVLGIVGNQYDVRPGIFERLANFLPDYSLAIDLRADAREFNPPNMNQAEVAIERARILELNFPYYAQKAKGLERRYLASGNGEVLKIVRGLIFDFVRTAKINSKFLRDYPTVKQKDLDNNFPYDYQVWHCSADEAERLFSLFENFVKFNEPVKDLPASHKSGTMRCGRRTLTSCFVYQGTELGFKL